jgi:hypothetical protein
MSKPQIILAGTRNELKYINEDLQRKCNLAYKLELSQYKDRSLGAAVYDETSNEYDIILCLYHGSKCVSSVTGRYNKLSSSMELLSKTSSEYEGLKFNLYLRTIFIYLMCFVRPSIKTIYSHSLNPISTYAMYKHYNASNSDLQEYVSDHNLTQETFTLQDAKNFHIYFIKKYTQTQESAKKELEDMLEECSIENDMDCSIEDLGWQSEKEAIEFIIATMNVRAITLELGLNTHGIQEFLLNKLLTTQIKCETQNIPQEMQEVQKNTGGRPLRFSSSRKSRRRKSGRRKSYSSKTYLKNK